jgi:uncharacterized protein (TIGR03437 family)
MSGLPKTPVYSGALLSLPLGNAPFNLSPSNISVLFGDRPAQIVSFFNGSLAVQVPLGLTPGVTLLRLFIDGVAALPAAIVIDPPPPIILSAQTLTSIPILAANPARPGDTIQILVSSLGDPASSIDIARLRISSGAVEHSVQAAFPNLTQPGTHIVQFSLSSASPNVTALPLSVTVDDRTSSTYSLAFRP